MKVTALAHRADGWWTVTVPEVDGAITQAKRLDQVPAMVADAVSLLEDVPVEDITVDVRPVLEEAEETAVTAALEAGRAAVEAQATASAAMRAAVRDLLPVMPARDVARVLHVSHQRVSQLAR